MQFSEYYAISKLIWLKHVDLSHEITIKEQLYVESKTLVLNIKVILNNWIIWYELTLYKLAWNENLSVKFSMCYY